MLLISPSFDSKFLIVFTDSYFVAQIPSPLAVYLVYVRVVAFKNLFLLTFISKPTFFSSSCKPLLVDKT